MSPKDPLPIFLPSRYLLAMRGSEEAEEVNIAGSEPPGCGCGCEVLARPSPSPGLSSALCQAEHLCGRPLFRLRACASRS